MSRHRDDSDDEFTTQPIGGTVLSESFDPPPPPPPSSPRHSSSENVRRFRWSVLRSGGVWWKVLVVFVVLWALGRFGGDPEPAPVAPAGPTCTQPAPKASGQAAFVVGSFLLPHIEGQ